MKTLKQKPKKDADGRTIGWETISEDNGPTPKDSIPKGYSSFKSVSSRHEGSEPTIAEIVS